MNESNIEADGFGFQSVSIQSGQFGTTIELGVTRDTFVFKTDFKNLDCLSVQSDKWWHVIITLLYKYKCDFDDFHQYGSLSGKVVPAIFERFTTNLHDVSDDDFGLLYVSWGNPQDLESSFKDGIEVFKLLHTLNHGLYRTRYLRDKRSISRAHKKAL
ncbi:hypothetical protein [Ferrimonas balearica]|uniref:hypothetical protein n=1 Tax=Ferrimonas balearica TaxID=44012 RepID=UPI0011D098C0|nr:hypothetical protein [Ferrimonas balearica]